MANKNLFQTLLGTMAPKTDHINEAGGAAYKMTPKQALAQYAATGTLYSTFYATDAQQLNTILKVCSQVDAEFIAKTAVYAVEKRIHERLARFTLRRSFYKRARLFYRQFSIELSIHRRCCVTLCRLCGQVLLAGRVWVHCQNAW